jgi:hypothetical protein
MRIVLSCASPGFQAAGCPISRVFCEKWGFRGGHRLTWQIGVIKKLRISVYGISRFFEGSIGISLGLPPVARIVRPLEHGCSSSISDPEGVFGKRAVQFLY